VTAWADAEGSGFTFATTNDLNCPVYNAALFGAAAGSISAAAAPAAACSDRA
jgi:hypothetical protein